MGVRLALGAGPDRIMRLVLGTGLRQLAVGLSIGLAVGAFSARFLEVMMYGVNVADPIVYLAIAGTLMAAGLVAVFVPARTATRTPPAEAMRNA